MPKQGNKTCHGKLTGNSGDKQAEEHVNCLSQERGNDTAHEASPVYVAELRGHTLQLGDFSELPGTDQTGSETHKGILNILLWLWNVRSGKYGGVKLACCL